MGIALILLLLGALFTWIGWRTRKKVQASMAWPTAPGKVVTATVRQDFQRGDDDSPDTTNYTPVIQYEYQVNGQLFKSNRLAFQERSYGTHKKAAEVAAGFPPGAALNVFYDPAKPADAVLERTAPGNNVALILGPLFLVAALVMAVKSL